MRAATLAPLVVLAGCLGCSGERFSSSPVGKGGGMQMGGAGAGGSAASGADASAGDAGEGDGGNAGKAGGASAGGAASGGAAGTQAGTGGSGNHAGTGGSAGAEGECTCPAGQYCRNGSCRDCSSLSSLEFGAPEEILDHEQDPLRFPRQGDTTSALFFRRGPDDAARIWYVPALASAAPGVLDAAGAESQSGLLYLASGDLGFNALFDETRAGVRSIRAATWSGAVLGGVGDAASPLAPSGFGMYSVALAAMTQRAYFMSERDGTAALRSGTLGSDEDSVVELDVPAAGGIICPRIGDDATPWVTPDGHVLAFRAPPLDSECKPVDGGATDLYAAPIDPTTGEPSATAVALDGVNVSEDDSTETDPSFSPDLCWLYFASDGGARLGHDFRLYRARRR